MQYSRVNVGSHSEQGAGDINLRVDRQEYDFLQSTLGVKAERVIHSSRGAFAPEVHFKWLHEFGDTTMQQTATFASGGGSFASRGVKQDRDMYNLGAGFTFLPCDCDTEKTWTVKALYDYKWTRNDYSSHQLSVMASLKW